MSTQASETQDPLVWSQTAWEGLLRRAEWAMGSAVDSAFERVDASLEVAADRARAMFTLDAWSGRRTLPPVRGFLSPGTLVIGRSIAGAGDEQSVSVVFSESIDVSKALARIVDMGPRPRIDVPFDELSGTAVPEFTAWSRWRGTTERAWRVTWRMTGTSDPVEMTVADLGDGGYWLLEPTAIGWLAKPITPAAVWRVFASWSLIAFG